MKVINVKRLRKRLLDMAAKKATAGDMDAATAFMQASDMLDTQMQYDVPDEVINQYQCIPD